MNIDLEKNNNLNKMINKYINGDEKLEYELEAIITKKISSDQLYKLLGVLKSKYQVEKKIYLNIYNNNTRIEVIGINNIKELYLNEDITEYNSFVYKEKIDEYKDNNYDIKFNLKTEMKPSEIEINKFKDNYTTIEKFYRLIERYSFIDNNIKIDISIVKQNVGISILESNIFFQPIKYEIEVEYINKNDNIENIIQTFYKKILFIIQILENSPYPLKNKDKERIFSEYMKIINHTNIGPKPIGMAENTINNIKLSDIDNNNYMITMKADGDRYILFINELGLVYLINTNKEVIDTSLISNIKNTIIDGEFITKYNSLTTLLDISLDNTNINYIFMYKAFDIYYLNGEIVYNNSLVDRINLIRTIKFEKNTNFALDFSIKDYYNLDDVNIIIENDLQHKLGFNIDGLIYQYIEPYTDKTILYKSNYRILKWKPEKFNSIDFLVNLEYENNIIKVKFSSLYSYNLFNKNINVIKPFLSIKPYIYNINIQYEDNIPITEEGTKIENNTIVECRYDIELNKWIYMRSRTDKTHKLQEGIIKSTANNIYIANDIFSSIFYPITLTDISTSNNLKQILNKFTDYYYTYEQNELDRTDLQKFHNIIKKELINNAVHYLSSNFDNIKCLDLGIGHGGDIKKYVNTNHIFNNQNNKLKKGISVILGIELNQHNIEHYNFKDNKYGSRAKFMNICTEYKDITNIPSIIKNTDCYIIQGDLNLDVLKKNTKLILNNYDKDVFNIVWDKYKIDKNPFELIVCNFCFHYFIQDLYKYNNILNTNSNNLQNNGLFIVTFMDGDKVIELFEKEQKNEIDCGFATLRKIDKFNKKFGIQIGVKLKTTLKEEIEYIVNFDTLIEQCNKHHLYLSTTNYLKYDNKQLGYFKDIKFKYTYDLGFSQKYTYLHRYAIFQKNDNSIKKVKKITKKSSNNSSSYTNSNN